MKVQSKKIREAARGQDCTLQIMGVCQNRTDTVVLCHIHDEHKGVGNKASDTSAVFGCHECHQVLDGVVRCEDFEESRYWYLLRALQRTVERLCDLGVYL